MQLKLKWKDLFQDVQTQNNKKKKKQLLLLTVTATPFPPRAASGCR